MNPECPGYHVCGPSIVRDGTFLRKDWSRRIQSYKCKECRRKFSSATLSPAYRQKKRRINSPLRSLLASGVSMRRAAILLGISKDTVAHRLPYLARIARESLYQYLVRVRRQKGLIEDIQFDDLITFEHSKSKPICVLVSVVAKTRGVLDVYVSIIPANGPKVLISRLKYGKRREESRAARNSLVERMTEFVSPTVDIKIDQDAHYSVLANRRFPQGRHLRYKSIRGCVTGQGESKKTIHDPLFTFNHTLALLRANINRLVRRSWCTTKRADRLLDHIAVFVDDHCKELLGQQTQQSD